MATYTGTPSRDYFYELGDRNGKTQGTVYGLTITLATQGGATNTITAAALGIKAGQCTKVLCRQFIDGGAQKRAVWLFTDGTNIYVGDPTNATDATRGIPGDVTGTLSLEVVGLPA